MAIKPSIREALRRQQVTVKDLTESQRERAERADAEGLKGKAAVEWIMAEPQPVRSVADTATLTDTVQRVGPTEREPRDPEAANLAERAQTFAGTKSRFWANEARLFLDTFTVDLGDPKTVTVLRDGRNVVLDRQDVISYALGELNRAERKPVSAALAEVNNTPQGEVAVHWDRALAAMIAVLYANETSP